jgi:hypothetical protein
MPMVTIAAAIESQAKRVMLGGAVVVMACHLLARIELRCNWLISRQVPKFDRREGSMSFSLGSIQFGGQLG